ncbi:putative outer membrane protein [Pedobacter sp. BAL39]|nr:putative outer membrane protein [Pedobacter sp. BAL39]
MLLLVFFLPLNLRGFAASAQNMNNTMISFSAKNMTLKQVLKVVEEKSNFLIGYDNVLDVKKRVTMTVESKSVYAVLKQLLRDYKGNVVQVDDSHVLIKVQKQEIAAAPVKVEEPVVNNNVQVLVSGTVTDTKNGALPGVTVVDETSGKKTGTDAEGKYSISVASGSKLSFNYIGYDKQTVTITNQKTVNIKLQESSNSLQEVVAIGYQKIRKSDVVGSISSVKASEMNLTAPTVGQALVGKVAGVQVSQTSGAPYAGTKIRVRGTSSLTAGSDPLYVVDGYPAGNNIFINPEDIETIDILKDAASSAIYGSRAAGGVVLITTKRGKDGKGKFSYDVQSGITQLGKKVKLLNGSQFAELVIDARNNAYKDFVVNGGKTWTDAMYSDDNATRIKNVGNGSSVSIPTDIYDFANQRLIAPTVDTDWQDELYRNAFFQRHNLSFSGGNDNMKYYLSGGYQDQDGIVRNTAMKALNFRANVDGNVSERLKVGANVAFTQTTNNEVGEGRFSPMMAALLYVPYLPARDANGNPIKYGMNAIANEFGIQGIENPLASVAETKSNRLGYRSTYNANATYQILDGLSFKTNLGAQLYQEKYDYYLPTSLSAGGGNPPYSNQSMLNANAIAQNKTELDKLAEFTLNYTKKFGKHDLNALAGYSAQQNTIDFTRINAKGFTSDNIGEISDRGAAADLLTIPNAFKVKTTLMSYFGRIGYNYAGKYFVTASLRTDGSSRFGPQNKWGTFPSVATGWSLSQEDWYNDFLGEGSSVKLRASWGLSGNNNIADYKAIQTVKSPGGVVFGSGTVGSGVLVGDMTDQTLGWESTSQYNFGTDITVFKNRLSFIFNYYLSRSYNLLYDQPVSSISGTANSTILTNLDDSKVQNKGFDFQVDGRIIQSNDFTLGLSGNISLNRNKVLNLSNGSTILVSGAERSYRTHITQEGQPIGMFYGFRVLGRITEDNLGKVAPSASSSNPAKVGDLYFEDVNGDGVVNDLDKTVIGTPYAKFTYGFAINAAYKSFDLRASFNGSYGNQVLDGQDYYLYNFEGSGNQYVEVADRYRSPSQPGSGLNYRASRAGTQSNNTRLSSFYLQSGSYLRMTNATIGYNFPKALSKKIKVENVRVFASVDNAFTITKYKGYNPDVDYSLGANLAPGATTNNGANMAPGVDYGNYPIARAYNLGIKLTF